MSRTFRDNVAVYFSQRPNVWIDSMALEMIGGRCAWRTRVSECRTELGMAIENRQRFQKDHAGRRWTTSEYMWVPAVEAQPDPEPVETPVLREHDLGGWR